MTALPLGMNGVNPCQNLIIYPHVAPPVGVYLNDKAELIPELLHGIGVPQVIVSDWVYPPHLWPNQCSRLDPGIFGKVNVREVQCDITHRTQNARPAGALRGHPR